MSVQDNLKRGSVDLVLLTLLKDEDMYGYQISHELARRSSGRYKLLESSMYPILYRLIDKGMISDHKELVGKRRIRVYYHLEEKGRAYLAQALEDYLSTMGGVLEILGMRIEKDEPKEQ
ncbi:MAG: helix-turn-helix transcriptional regulator [Clostridia bacterium]|nr:helix-turn-helix transcriptional regulator [Clostridia bacterium]